MLRRFKNNQPNKPTTAELAILEILWASGPSTVREVYERLSEQKPTQYTTTLKLMQIMRQKGLVRRDEKKKAHVYRVAQSQAQTRKNVLRDVLERFFQGSASNLVQQVLETKAASPEELAEIRKMIEDAVSKGGDR